MGQGAHIKRLKSIRKTKPSNENLSEALTMSKLRMKEKEAEQLALRLEIDEAKQDLAKSFAKNILEFQGKLNTSQKCVRQACIVESQIPFRDFSIGFDELHKLLGCESHTDAYRLKQVDQLVDLVI